MRLLTKVDLIVERDSIVDGVAILVRTRCLLGGVGAAVEDGGELRVIVGAVLIQVELEADTALIRGIVAVAAFDGDFRGSHGCIAAGSFGILARILRIGLACRKAKAECGNGERRDADRQKFTEFHCVISLSSFSAACRRGSAEVRCCCRTCGYGARRGMRSSLHP